MHNLLFQLVLPFFLSAIVVIIITVIAERYGTKTGGILGTLPSTMVVALILIALNNGIDTASRAVTVIPAEMGINILFLFVFVMLSRHTMYVAVPASLALWTALTTILFFMNIKNIFLSLAIYIFFMIPSFLSLEFFRKTPSSGRAVIHYTPAKILLRGLLAGVVVTLAVFLANLNASLSGIFSVFPVIFLSTMIIFVVEHGHDFAGAMAKSMIFGTPTVIGYSISIYFFYPALKIFWGTIAAYVVSIVITLSLLRVRNRMT
ncbi:MAG: DUF3147 family protein [Nitrospiraceae bacterium]|nr:DUF3147 family protein [Nitrospiraceae bacterium]